MIISTEPLHIVLVSALAIMAGIQIFYYLKYYRRAAYFKQNNITREIELPPLSVVICARNEAANLSRFLPGVLEQDYPQFEVIVVNDCSEDETMDVLGEMLKRYSHLKVSTIMKDPGFTHAKKLAMLIGIKAATHDLLVFTDADCCPAGKNWLSYMASSSANAEITLGYGGYCAAKGFLNRYIRYETMFTGMQYTGMALAGVPYMGVGRNLAYTRSCFFARGGFGPHNHILSGDDDLFVNRNANASNCTVVLNTEAYTWSVAPKSVGEWVRQKRRHFTTAKYYKTPDKIRLFIEPFSRVSYYGLLITLLIMLVSWPVVAGIALSRLLTRSLIINKTCKTLNEPHLWFFSLFFDILSPFVTTSLYLTRTRKGKRSPAWK